MPFSKNFFDLSSFYHKDIFILEEPIWNTLKFLISYLDSLSLGKIKTEIPAHCHLVNSNKISIGEGTIVQPGAYIEGPCIIGSNCVIRHNAYLRPYVLIGNHSVIGHCSEVKHSIMLDYAKAPHFNFVGDSILGNHVNLGAGVVLANFRLDAKEVNIQIEEKKIPTGLKKLGAIIGDEASLGCNSVTNPGSLLKKRFRCRPCSNIQGNIYKQPKVRIQL